MKEVDGPVERVDHPLQAGAGRRLAALFAQRAGLGGRLAQEAPDEVLGAQVRFGHDVGR